ncbi:TIM barrel protein [Chryseolinea sp. T2]|uniref:TIM barrel protein n=1 Tax=Chryseolinea sp. T2 TaxID=3129255 RepID=UPI0030768AAF
MISEVNEVSPVEHKKHVAGLEFLKNALELSDQNFSNLVSAVQALQVAIPSWALGTGGTRFGRFPEGGEPRSLEEKIEDVGIIRNLTRATNSVSLHIPWDIPKDVAAIQQMLHARGLVIDSVNSNTFQDQAGQPLSYKFGSLCHTSDPVRNQAIQHNIEVIEHGKSLGSKVLTVWLADGSNFPGQHNFRRAFARTQKSLEQIYKAMPADWTMLVEYKPYEPSFYSMVIPDWGTSHELCKGCGDRAHVLVDLGHHLPNTNIEQIVARLLHIGRLGGFHFNGSQYGDDDLTTGAIKPFQLFLIFHELATGASDTLVKNPPVAYMIDASHNLKDPIEDLMISLENIRTAYAKALLVDIRALEQAQHDNDVVACEQILQRAFQTDVRPIVAEARIREGGALNPLESFRSKRIRTELIAKRGRKTIATGL